MNALVRRAAAGALVAGAVAALATGIVPLRVHAAVAALGLGGGHGVPFALVRPLWSDDASGATRDARAMLVIRREQRSGVLRAVLGRGAVRLVRAGELLAGGRPVGRTLLLALPAARHNVRATVPAVDLTWPSGGAARRATFTARTLRDVLVDVDLRRNAILSVEPGPASQTSAWSGPRSRSSDTAAAASHTAPPLVRLSPDGPAFAPYDGTQALGAAGRDWPVSLVFAGHATIAKVKQGLRAAGFTGSGFRRSLAYAQPGATVSFDGDRGLKTPCDANGTDVHLRLYAPPGTDRFHDPRFGDVVVATAHLDHGDGCGPAPRLYGFSEAAEHRAADAIAARLGWRVQRDSVPLGNAEPFRRDLAAPDHLWWSNGRATLVSVP